MATHREPSGEAITVKRDLGEILRKRKNLWAPKPVDPKRHDIRSLSMNYRRKGRPPDRDIKPEKG